MCCHQYLRLPRKNEDLVPSLLRAPGRTERRRGCLHRLLRGRAGMLAPAPPHALALPWIFYVTFPAVGWEQRACFYKCDICSERRAVSTEQRPLVMGEEGNWRCWRTNTKSKPSGTRRQAAGLWATLTGTEELGDRSGQHAVGSVSAVSIGQGMGSGPGSQR